MEEKKTEPAAETGIGGVPEPTAEGLAAELGQLESEASAVVATGAAPAAPPAPGPAASEAYQEILEPILYKSFQILAPAWEVEAEESQALAGAYAELLGKYFPDVPSEFGPELGAAFVTVAILATRMGKPRKIEKVVGAETPAANEAPAAAPAEKPGGDVQVKGELAE